MRSLILLFLPLSAFGADTVQPSLELTAVRIEVTWAESMGEIETIAARYTGERQWPNRVTQKTAHGFSVLGKRNGEWVCLLFVLKPKRMNDRNTTALGHELAHCLLGDYHD